MCESAASDLRGGPRSPHHVQEFSHMYNLRVPLRHFQQGKFVYRRYYQLSKQQYFT